MNLRLLLPVLSLCALSSAPAAIISQWNFNGSSATTVPGGALAPTPSIGSGTAGLLGGVSATFASGITQGGSSDPVTTVPANYGWNLAGFPAATASNLTAGVEFAVSTVGFSAVTVNYDLRHSNSSARHEAVQYSLDGSTFTTITYFAAPTGDTWFNNRTVDLSAIAGANENANFKIRILSSFESTANGGVGAASYIGSGGAYATTGTWRFDMVTINGVPEPSASLLALLAAPVLLRRRRTA